MAAALARDQARLALEGIEKNSVLGLEEIVQVLGCAAHPTTTPHAHCTRPGLAPK